MVGDDNTILSASEVAGQIALIRPWNLTASPQAVRQIVTSHEALSASRKALIDALAKYGNHRPGCPALYRNHAQGRERVCNCGFDAWARESVHDETEGTRAVSDDLRDR